jgi:DNA-binding transcriptional regulator YiaG
MEQEYTSLAGYVAPIAWLDTSPDIDETWTVVTYKHYKDWRQDKRRKLARHLDLPHVPPGFEAYVHQMTQNGGLNTNQDWQDFIVKKKKPTARRTQVSGEVIKKAKLDAETEGFVHQRVKPELARKIQDYRRDNKLTQSELAHKLNVKDDIVRDYENGSAIPDGKILEKFHRFFESVKVAEERN